MTQAPSARAVQLMEITDTGETGKPLLGANMELIQDVKVRLSVSVGQCEMTVQQLFALKEGEVAQLDRTSQDPVELYLEGKLIGLGDLVVVGEHFGVRVTELGGRSST